VFEASADRLGGAVAEGPARGPVQGRPARRGRSRTGLTVHAEADNSSYPRGIKISDAQMLAIKPQFKPDKFHGEWNYLVKPAIPAPTAASN